MEEVRDSVSMISLALYREYCDPDSTSIAAVPGKTGQGRRAHETIRSVQATIRSGYICPVGRNFGDAIGIDRHGFTPIFQSALLTGVF